MNLFQSLTNLTLEIFPSLNQLTLEIHIVLFAFFALLMMLAGFLLGRKQVAQKQKRIIEVENEMLAAHKEILESTKRNKQLTEALEKAKVPVPLFPSQREDEAEGDEKVRKIPLGKIG